MKRASKRKAFLVIFAFFAGSILLFSHFNFSMTFASSEDNVTALPDFLEKLLSTLLPDANPETLDRIRMLWINQVTLKQSRIEATDGAVLNFNSSSLDYQITGYIIDAIETETTYGGQVVNPDNIEGYYADDDFTRLYAPYYDPVDPYKRSQAAVVGELSNPYACGDVYASAKLGPTGEGQNGNLLYMMGSNDPDASLEEWCEGYIGYNEITHPYNQSGSEYAYIGYTSNTYAYVMVGVVNMGGISTYNDVLVDRITFSHSNPPTPTRIRVYASIEWEIGDVNVWVDDEYAGNTGYMYLDVNVSPGNHTVEVDPEAEGLPFRYFIGYDEEENPITVYVPPGTTVELIAYYSS